MRRLEDIARDIRPIVARAVADLGSDLGGFSIIDLVADNIEDRISTSDIRSALVIAGVDDLVSARLCASYSRRAEG